MNRIGNTVPSGNTTGAAYASPSQTKKPQEEEDAKSQQVNSATVSSNIAPATGTAESQTPSQTGNNVFPAYSVQISEEGSQLNSLNTSTTKGKPSGNSTDASTVSTSASASASSTSSSSDSAVIASSEESTSTDDSDTSSLSQYSAYQLRQMLNNGEITQSEYNTEISQREAKQEAEAANSKNMKNTNVDDVK